MQRLSSTIVAGAWIGWHAILAASAAAELPAFSIGGRIFLEPGPLMLATAGFHAALMLLGILSIHAIHDRSAERRTRGEVGLLIVLVVGACLAAGSFLASGGQGDPSLFITAVAVSFLALGFDRLVFVDEDEDDDAAFKAALAVIASSLATQTRLHTAAGEPSAEETFR